MASQNICQPIIQNNIRAKTKKRCTQWTSVTAGRQRLSLWRHRFESNDYHKRQSPHEGETAFVAPTGGFEPLACRLEDQKGGISRSSAEVCRRPGRLDF